MRSKTLKSRLRLLERTLIASFTSQTGRADGASPELRSCGGRHFSDIGSMTRRRAQGVIDSLTAREQEVCTGAGSCTGRSTSEGRAVNRLRENRPRADPDQRATTMQRPVSSSRPLRAPDQASHLNRGRSWRSTAPSAVRQRRGGQILPEVRRLSLPSSREGQTTTMTYTVR